MFNLNLKIITNSGNEYEVDQTRCNIVETAKIAMRQKSEFMFIPFFTELATVDKDSKYNIKREDILINPKNISELKGSVIEFLVNEKFNK